MHNSAIAQEVLAARYGAASPDKADVVVALGGDGGDDNNGELPKAVIVVDLYGQCADYDALRASCER